MTRDLLELALTRFPGLYSRLIARRRTPNLEKIVFLSLIRRGDVVADIGANTGYYSLLFSHLVGARGSVHAFEPVPLTFAELAARMRRARFGNVVLNESALAEDERTASIYLPGNDLGQAALAPHRFGSWTTDAPVHTYPCHTTTLDAYVGLREMRSLSFVKCDVEGAELPVLRGARESIRRFTPLVFAEVSPQWSADFSYQPADLARFLETFGYTRFFLLTNSLTPIRDLRGDLDPGRLPASANLLCAQESHAPRLARLQRWLRPRREPMLESRDVSPAT